MRWRPPSSGWAVLKRPRRSPGPDADSVAEHSCRLAALVDVLRDTGRAAEAEPLARALLAAQAGHRDHRNTKFHVKAHCYLAQVLSGDITSAARGLPG